MATLAVQQFNEAAVGKAITFSAAAGGGDRTQPGDGVFLLVRNGSGSSINVTLDVPGEAFNGTALADTVVAVAAGAEKLIPVRREYTSDVDGLAGIAYSDVTTVTVAVLQF